LYSGSGRLIAIKNITFLNPLIIKLIFVDIYLRKKRWKLFLFSAAILIVAVSLYYTNILVNEIRRDERKNVEIWADAIHRKADLVNFTNKKFEEIKDEERRRVSILAQAHRRLNTAYSSDELNFLLGIISENTSIPVIQTDKDGNIQSTKNVDLPDTMKRLIGSLKKDFSVYPPIVVNYFRDEKIILYYKDSKVFSELKTLLDDLIRSFFS